MKLFNFLPRIRKSIRKNGAIAAYCLKHNLPFARTRRQMKAMKANEKVSAYALMRLGYLVNDPAVNDTFMFRREYYNKTIEINKPDKLHLFKDKTEFYRRCPKFLGRECLDVTTASPAEVEEFMKRHKRFVGKMNFGMLARSFGVYDTSKMTVEQILEKMKKMGQTLLEEYIVQHETIMDIYPGSVNTIRLHTISNGSEVRMFLKPMFRMGSNGSVVDASAKNGSYRAFIEDDGSLSHHTYVDNRGRCKKAVQHHNTKVRFDDVRLPYMPEAVQLVKLASAYFPELPCIGWDVAITPQGPVIVEGNGTSGAEVTYQQMVYLYENRGARQELQDMFDYGWVQTGSPKI